MYTTTTIKKGRKKVSFHINFCLYLYRMYRNARMHACIHMHACLCIHMCEGIQLILCLSYSLTLVHDLKEEGDSHAHTHNICV